MMPVIPTCVAEFFTWDARSQNFRATGRDYRAIVEALRAQRLGFKDDVVGFSKLELSVAREVRPYPH
ncbi:hypothetical protein DESA109040_12805 [Deinococcus saxicola]